jgi:lysophospholipase L1-like esterase
VPRRPIAAAVLLLCLLAASRAEPAEPPPLEGVPALRPFFAALAQLDLKRTRQPVRILQLGDSHTANDSFSGRLRERLQARFGAAGRGWLPAGIPFAYYRPALVTAEETGWRHVKPGAEAAGLPLGLDGVAAEAVGPDSRMILTSSEPEGFDRVAIALVARPGGAPLALRLDNGKPRPVSTAAPRPAWRRIEVLLPSRAKGHRVELLAPRAAGQQVLGWAVERRVPGIIYENHGSIGATVALVEKLDEATVASELADRRPALLVVAFGTNEGFDDTLDLARYAARFRAAVAALAHSARGAAVLVLGPPDGNRLPQDCAKDIAAACGSRDGACAWTAPRNLAAVRDIQRRAARRHGWAFWDWSAAMGGSCGIERWLGHDPPLAMPDHVHLNKTGYAATADALFSALMREYDSWRRDRPLGR